MVQPKQWKRDMRFGTWNVRNLYRSGSLTAAARELATNKLDLVGVKVVRWDTGKAEDYNFFKGKGNENHQLGTTTVKRVEFVSERMTYIALRGRWCNNIIQNVHAPSEEKSDDSKDSFYEELQQVFFVIFLSTI